MKQPIPKNIKKASKTFVGNFTLRQCAAIVAGGGTGALCIWLFGKIMPFLFAVFLAMIPALPIILTGFITVSGLHFEQILMQEWRNAFYKANIRSNVQTHLIPLPVPTAHKATPTPADQDAASYDSATTERLDEREPVTV